MKTKNLNRNFINPTSINSKEVLSDPNSTLADVFSLNNFVSMWIHSDPSLFSFLIDHYEEFIELGFQIKSNDKKNLRYSIRCQQIMNSNNSLFRSRFYTETKFLNFIYDFIFNISSYSFQSQKIYFCALPNIMIDKKERLNQIFDEKYFIELFNHIENDFIYNFCVKLIFSSPYSILKVLKRIEPSQIVINKIINESSDQIINIRNQNLFINLIGSKIEGNACSVLYQNIDLIIEKGIQKRDKHIFKFLKRINEYSSKQICLSRWKSIAFKFTPYINSFCEIVLSSGPDTFIPLYESCTILSIRIISTTKKVPEIFIVLFKKLSLLFFVLKRNSFLHNCFYESFKLLISLNYINSKLLDDLDLFNKVIEAYINRDADFSCCFWGQLRLISEMMDSFALNSKTVDVDKWKKIVVDKNKTSERIIEKRYGGHVPFNTNIARRSGVPSALLIAGGLIIVMLIFIIIFIITN